MQAVVLAGGVSSRFYPYNRFAHKSNVKVLGKTILEHTLLSIKKSGITDVIVIVSPQNPIQNEIDVKKIGLSVSFIVQPKALGMGDAVLQAKDHIKGDFFVLNASHVDFHLVNSVMLEKISRKNSMVLLAREERDVSAFGVLKIDNGKVLAVVEKPAKGTEPSNLKVVGVYLFPKEFLTVLEVNNNKHYSLEEAITAYAQQNSVEYVITEKELMSLKYPWDLLRVKDVLLSNAKHTISKNAHIAKNAIVENNVTICDNAKVLEGAVVKGPCYIGENVVIGNNVLVRKNSVIEKDCVIGANTEVSDCLFMEGTKIHSGYVGDSIIGRNCRLAAYFCTGNRRLDRREILVKSKQEEHLTQLTSLGVIMGDDVHTGVHVSTMPGVIVGNSSVVGPSTTVFENIEEGVLFYTKFNSVVKKK